MITIDDEGYAPDSMLPKPKKRNQAVTVEQSGSSAGRKSKRMPYYFYDKEDSEEQEEPDMPKPTPKKQKTKDTEQKTKATERKAKPVSGGKVTLRQTLGISRDEARKLAKHHMNMATKLMEDTDEE